VIGAAVLAALIALRDVRITLTNRRWPGTSCGRTKLRKLASEVVSYRPLRSDESIPTSSSPSSMRRSRADCKRLFVLGDLMEVPLERSVGSTRWFIDSTQTVSDGSASLRNRAKGTLPNRRCYSSQRVRTNSYFITGRGSSAGPPRTSESPSRFLRMGRRPGETLRRHQAQITRSGAAVLRQPPTLEAGPALVRRLREHATRWRATQRRLSCWSKMSGW